MLVKIILELEHIDGDNKNNVRTNLECICLNCHSMTDTWRGKNRKDLKRIKKLTLEDFKDAYIKYNGNIRKALLSLEVSAKGGNYKRMYLALDCFNINYIKQSNKKMLV